MQWTTNSGEAVPGLTGLAGTILVVSLILLVLGAAVGVIGVYVSRKQRNSGLMAGLLMDVMRVGFGAAVLGGLSASIVAGSTLYQVPKVEAEKVAPPTSTGQCSQSRSVTIANGVWEDQFSENVEVPEFDAPLYSGEAQYWPDPANGCGNGTVDACRMVHLTGTTGDETGMSGFEKVDEWIPPKGECSSGEPEEVDF